MFTECVNRVIPVRRQVRKGQRGNPSMPKRDILVSGLEPILNVLIRFRPVGIFFDPPFSSGRLRLIFPLHSAHSLCPVTWRVSSGAIENLLKFKPSRAKVSRAYRTIVLTKQIDHSLMRLRSFGNEWKSRRMYSVTKTVPICISHLCSDAALVSSGEAFQIVSKHISHTEEAFRCFNLDLFVIEMPLIVSVR